MRYTLVLSFALFFSCEPSNHQSQVARKEVVSHKEQVNEIDKDYTMKYWEANTEFYIVTESREVIEVDKKQFVAIQPGDTIEVLNGKLVTTTELQWSR